MSSQAIADFEAARKVLLERALPPQRRNYTLDRMRAFMDFLGNPQDKLRVVHVAGTSGKTSTSYYIASLLHEAGKRTALSVSPYVCEINERVQIGLVPLGQEEFCRALAEFLQLAEESGMELSYFELLTAFAYWQFARSAVDWAVIETGLGGELDATNVVERTGKVCVIADIGLDHQSVLGDTIEEIAAHKAGIIRPGSKVVMARQGSEAMDVVRERCRVRRAHLLVAEPAELTGAFDFLPLFQQRNFGLALAVYEELAERNQVPELDTGKQLRTARVHIPGRMEAYRLEGKTIILDGAHNEQKFQALMRSLAHRYPGQPVAALTGFKAGHTDRVANCTAELVKHVRHVVATTFGMPGGSDPYGEDPDLVAAMCKIHGFAEVEAVTEPAHAWSQLLKRPEPILLVCGSFYLLSEVYPLLGEQVTLP